MEAIKTKGFAKNGMLTVVVPQRFEEQELEVIVLSKNGATTEADKEEEWKQKVVRRLSIIGSAKNPTAPIDDYDVYDQ